MLLGYINSYFISNKNNFVQEQEGLDIQYPSLLIIKKDNLLTFSFSLNFFQFCKCFCDYMYTQMYCIFQSTFSPKYKGPFRQQTKINFSIMLLEAFVCNFYCLNFLPEGLKWQQILYYQFNLFLSIGIFVRTLNFFLQKLNFLYQLSAKFQNLNLVFAFRGKVTYSQLLLSLFSTLIFCV